MNMLRSRFAKLLAAVVIGSGAVAFAVGQVREADAARRDQADVARMTKNMKTVCMGRFLIDLPQETHLELRGPRIDGLNISSVDESKGDFQARLVQREAELRAIPDQFGGNKNLESVKEVMRDNGVFGKIFFHSRKVTEGTQANGLELERYRDEGIAIEAEVHGLGVSFSLAAGDYDPDKVEDLPGLVAKLVPNPLNKIPTEPGFCIDRAWFRDPLTADRGEEIMMSAQLTSHPDIQFLTILAAGNKPAAQSVLERSENTEARLPLTQKFRGSSLRADPRTIGGITGDELIRRVDEINDAVVYTFWWEVAETETSVFIPHFVFKMYVGKSQNGPVPSSLSHDAAVTLWDRISSSIRFHHPAPNKGSRPAPLPSQSARAALASET